VVIRNHIETVKITGCSMFIDGFLILFTVLKYNCRDVINSSDEKPGISQHFLCLFVKFNSIGLSLNLLKQMFT